MQEELEKIKELMQKSRLNTGHEIYFCRCEASWYSGDFFDLEHFLSEHKDCYLKSQEDYDLEKLNSEVTELAELLRKNPELAQKIDANIWQDLLRYCPNKLLDRIAINRGIEMAATIMEDDSNSVYSPIINELSKVIRTLKITK